MAGMTTTGAANASGYGNRTVEIEVTGIARQDVSRLSSYTIKVPYSRMFQTMQGIYNLGGTVAKVSVKADPGAPAVAPPKAAGAE